jgi:drug/metabolite transporter (DMT)-like permease
LVFFTKIGNNAKPKCDTIVVQLMILLSSIFFVYLVTFLYLFFNKASTLVADLKALEPIVFFIIIIEGLLGSFFGLFFITKATEFIGPSKASVLRCSNPLFTTLFSIVILKEDPGIQGVISIFVLMLGIIIVSYRNKDASDIVMDSANLVGMADDRRRDIFGSIFALLSGLSFSMSQITRGLAINYGATPLIIILISFPFSFFVLYIVFCVKYKSYNFFKMLTPANFQWFTWGGISSMVGNFALSQSFEFIPVWRAVAIRNTQPIIAIAVSWLFLKKEEKITFRLVSGALLVILGVFLSLTK